MIFSENRFPLFRIMLYLSLEHDLFGKPVPTFPDHALSQISGSNWLPVPQPREKRGGKRQRESLGWCRMGGPSEAEACIPCQHVKTRAFRATLRL
jgi:hypothetical protein